MVDKELPGSPSFAEGGQAGVERLAGGAPPSIVPEQPTFKLKPNQVTWEEVFEYFRDDKDPIDPDRWDFGAVTIKGRRYLKTGNPPEFWPVDCLGWPPRLSVSRTRWRPTGWVVTCSVCNKSRAYSFDPFRHREMFSLIRDCPRRLDADLSDKEIPPTSILRGTICPGVFWNWRWSRAQRKEDLQKTIECARRQLEILEREQQEERLQKTIERARRQEHRTRFMRGLSETVREEEPA
jgi:hypothetical protein